MAENGGAKKENGGAKKKLKIIVAILAGVAVIIVLLDSLVQSIGNATSKFFDGLAKAAVSVFGGVVPILFVAAPTLLLLSVIGCFWKAWHSRGYPSPSCCKRRRNPNANNNCITYSTTNQVLMLSTAQDRQNLHSLEQEKKLLEITEI